MGKFKSKGAYMHKRMPHQNVSKLIVPMAAEAFLTKNIPIDEFIYSHKDKKFEKPEEDPKFDFMISTKVPRSSRLVTCPTIVHGYDYDLTNGYDKLPALKEICEDSFETEMEVMLVNGNKQIHLGAQTEQNRVARYFVSNSTDDPWLIKIMPPLEKKPEQGERMFNLEAGRHISICTNARDFNWERLCYEYYIKETEKLIDLPERSIEDLEYFTYDEE